MRKCKGHYIKQGHKQYFHMGYFHCFSDKATHSGTKKIALVELESTGEIVECEPTAITFLNGEVQLEDKYTHITNMIRKLGVPASIKGYNYIRDALLITWTDITVLDSITKGLYPRIAEIHNTTTSRVERAIRHAIEVAWTRGDINEYHEIFKYSVDHDKGRPTNTEFIALLTDTLKMRYPHAQD